MGRSDLNEPPQVGGAQPMSEERKWTAGKWVATDDGCGSWKVRVYEGHEPHAVRIASVPHTHSANDNNEKSKANAHLIAAAPCLYEALDEMITWWVEDANATDPRLGHQVACDPRVQNAVDALKRAQGGEE